MRWRVLLVVAVLAALAVWLFQRRAQLSAAVKSAAAPKAPGPVTAVTVAPTETLEGEGEKPPADTETSYIPNRAWEKLQAELNGGNAAGHVVPPGGVFESDWPGNPSDDARYRAPTPEVWDATVQQVPWTADPATWASAFAQEAPTAADFRSL